MPSSEPGLLFGTGQPEVRADSSSAGSPLTSPEPNLVPSILPSRPVTHDQTRGQKTKNRGDLPPLATLSDLILEAPAWLFSAALHMIAVILLGLFFVVPERSFELLLSFDDGDGFEELGDSEFDLDLEQQDSLSDASLDPQELAALEDPVLTEAVDVNPPVLNTEALTTVEPIQMALSGRSEGMQQRLLEAYGGSAATQRSVMKALHWLARYQSGQGMWSLAGKYKNGAGVENREAATGLALLAFQGAGFTPHGDPQHDFTKVTSRAWRSLLKKQKEDGSFFHRGRRNGQLYTHAICTIALCELYGMTRDKRYHEPAQRAIDYCVLFQAPAGGWRYNPGADSDLSVTGWFVMALQSARMAGLQVPSPALTRISGFLDAVSYEGQVFYGYRKGQAGATQSMTAEGLLCRQYLGWTQSDSRLRSGAKYLSENPPSWKSGKRDVYYWYYATQVCHHMEGTYWRTWNDTMKVVLPKHQVQEGRDRGSWDPRGDEWGDEGGRLFVTCLSTYMLEVYYRHLPLYQASLVAK